MKIVELLKAKQADMRANKAVTIAFLGDSVTQGCFECYRETGGEIETVFDYPSAYSTRVREVLNRLYPKVQVNIINSGISGDGASRGLLRLERDVIDYHPDLAVISYGLNDSMGGLDKLDKYTDTLAQIFSALNEAGIETLFLTQNFMCDVESPHLGDDPKLKKVAEKAQRVQTEGVLKAYFEAAKRVCAEHGVRVCDLYAMWEKMSAAGVNTTDLLANYVNHPIREYHAYVAVKLVETFLD